MLKMRYILLAMLLLTVSTARSGPLSSPALSRHKEVVMGNNNGIITAPVSHSDPYVVMGVGKYNGWYDLGYICSNLHGKINPYAKYKPLAFGNQDTDLHVNDNWRGDDGLCGFSIPVYTSIGELTNGMISGVSISYKAPVAGKNWFRFTDFIGYNHYVDKGFFNEPNLSGNVVLDSGRNVYLDITSVVDSDPLSDYVTFADLAPVQTITGDYYSVRNMYVGILLYRNSKDQYTVVSDKRYGEMGDGISFGFRVPAGMTDKSYTYYIFFCQDRNLSPNTIFLPTDIPPTNVYFKEYGGGVEARIYIRSINDYDGEFTLEYINRDNKPVTFNGASATLYDDSTGEQLSFESVLNSFTLAAHETKVLDFTFSYDFDGYQNPDIESSYVLSVRSVTSYGNGDIVTDALFDRYPDGSWYEK